MEQHADQELSQLANINHDLDALSVMQQSAPAEPQHMQQTRVVFDSGIQQCQPGPGQQAIQQQRHNVPQSHQRSQGMAQRPVVQQSQPAVSQSQQSSAGASQAAKPPPVAKGRPINLLANHFAVDKRGPLTIFSYNVNMRHREAITRNKFRTLMQQFLQEDSRFIDIPLKYFGDKKLYTISKIPNVDSEAKIKFEFQPDQFVNITLKSDTQINLDLSPSDWDDLCEGGTKHAQPVITAYEHLLKYGASESSSNLVIENTLFSKPVGRETYLGNGVEVWIGHNQVFSMGTNPYAVVSISPWAFLKSDKVHKIMSEIYGTRIGERLDGSDLADFQVKITDLEVSYSNGQCEVTVGCNGIKGPANVEKLVCDGNIVTLQEYFEKILDTKLQYPNLPCVWVGSRDKNNLVPMELCCVVAGQRYRHKLSEVQTSSMVKVAATPADVFRQHILEAVRRMEFDDDPWLEGLGVDVEEDMTSIKGRVLPNPTLVYGHNKSSTIVPTDGVWNVRNMKFIEAKSMNAFGLINITRCCDLEIELFLSHLTNAAREMGLSIGMPLFNRSCQMRDLQETMIVTKTQYPDVQILFVILDCENDPTYDLVKRVGDLDLGIPTQCIQLKTVVEIDQLDFSVISNICLELNVKLGGTNYRIFPDNRPEMLFDEELIIIGASLIQVSGKPSISAVVGWIDPGCSNYCCEIRLQTSGKKFIEGMEEMVHNMIQKLNGGRNETFPKHIICYRDSEGLSETDLKREVKAIRRALKKLELRTSLIFIVVQKCHYTLLFPQDKIDEYGPGKNVPPGTIVDNTIVHPGTGRPTHYHVLCNESKLSANDVQLLTFELCFLFTQCTSLPFPAPCYYSHRVASRGCSYYENLTADTESLSSTEFQLMLQKYFSTFRGLDFRFFV